MTRVAALSPDTVPSLGGVVSEGTLYGQALIFLTTFLGFAIQIYREKRNRRWDLEDRERARLEIAAKVESVAAVTASRQEHVLQKIAENTAISRVAFNEANNVNTKLLKLAEMINAPYDRKASGIHDLALIQDAIKETNTAVKETQHTAEDTLAAVHKIDEKLT